MKNFKIAKIAYIISSIIIILTGFTIMINPGIATAVICRMSGIIMIIAGGAKIFGYFANFNSGSAFQFNFSLGVMLLALGIALCIIPGFFVMYFSIMISIIIIINSIFTIQSAIEAKKYGVDYWFLILIAGILSAIAGTITLINPAELSAFLMIMLGVSLIFDGVENIVVACVTAKYFKQIDKDNVIKWM